MFIIALAMSIVFRVQIYKKEVKVQTIPYIGLHLCPTFTT